MRIRHALREDADTIAALHVASWQESYAGMVPDRVMADMSVERRTAMWRKVLADPAAAGCVAVLVAEERDGIAAFSSCGPQRDAALTDAGFAGEIQAVYVRRTHQRRGTGRLLMAAAAQALVEVGHHAAALWVLRENNRARAFYRSLGGSVVGERNDTLFGAPVAEVAYGWRDLAPLAG